MELDLSPCPEIAWLFRLQSYNHGSSTAFDSLDTNMPDAAVRGDCLWEGNRGMLAVFDSFL